MLLSQILTVRSLAGAAILWPSGLKQTLLVAPTAAPVRDLSFLPVPASQISSELPPVASRRPSGLKAKDFTSSRSEPRSVIGSLSVSSSQIFTSLQPPTKIELTSEARRFPSGLNATIAAPTCPRPSGHEKAFRTRVSAFVELSHNRTEPLKHVTPAICFPLGLKATPR